MGKKQKIAYWLLPAAAICVASVAMSVGQSHARYNNSAVWHTVAEPARMTVTGDYLEQADRPPVTVLLGQIPLQSQEVSFTLNSTAGVSGALVWEVDRPEYLDVQMKTGEIFLSSGDTVSLEGDAPVTVTMTLTPTTQAAEPRQAMDVNIRVGWSDALAGTFRVELPAVAENEPAEVTEPEVTEPEVTEPEATEPEATEQETTEQETTEPETTEPQVTEQETTEPEVTESQPAVVLESFQTYHPELMFPVLLTAETEAQISLKLKLEETTSNFPQGTRFSLDSGASWYMLYREGEIPLNVPAGEPLTVLLDISSTALASEPELMITAGADTSVTLTASAEPVYEMSGCILTRETELTVNFAELWEGCELICSIDMLTSTETGKAYIPAEITQNGLMAEVSAGENGQQLTIRVGDTLPQPGTYRLNMSWRYHGTCIWQEKTNFFINYTGNTITNQTGGDRQ